MKLALPSGFRGFLRARPARTSLQAACGRGHPPQAPSPPGAASSSGHSRSRRSKDCRVLAHTRGPLEAGFKASDVLPFPRDPVVQNPAATREERLLFSKAQTRLRVFLNLLSP